MTHTWTKTRLCNLLPRWLAAILEESTALSSSFESYRWNIDTLSHIWDRRCKNKPLRRIEGCLSADHQPEAPMVTRNKIVRISLQLLRLVTSLHSGHCDTCVFRSTPGYDSANTFKQWAGKQKSWQSAELARVTFNHYITLLTPYHCMQSRSGRKRQQWHRTCVITVYCRVLSEWPGNFVWCYMCHLGHDANPGNCRKTEHRTTDCEDGDTHLRATTRQVGTETTGRWQRSSDTLTKLWWTHSFIHDVALWSTRKKKRIWTTSRNCW